MYMDNFLRNSDNVVVQDPKAIWDRALPKIQVLKNNFTAIIIAVGMRTYDPDYDEDDAAIALAVPVQLLALAIANMAEVKEIGEEIEKQEKKELILIIASIIFAIVPFVGEIGLSYNAVSIPAPVAWWASVGR